MVNSLQGILEKHKSLIALSEQYISKTNDFEHDANHTKDVLDNIIRLTSKLNKKFNLDVCIIAAYWHDVGRSIQNSNHEQLSAQILKKEMERLNYPQNLIDNCYNAIEFHGWDMKPKTIEGLIVRDADKLAWVGKGRWISCLKNNQKLDEILNLLSRLRNDILYFDESRIIFDELIVDIVKLLYIKAQ